jgi:glycosyltransferase involved in cell wall biosynthesis
VKISAILITLNEEKNLARALESLRCCDEIVIVDSGSQDATAEIAGKHGARVLQREFQNYADQKNFAAQAAAHDWVLAIDADEALSPALQEELRELKTRPPRFDSYSFPRRARYLGRWIKHSGWYPDRKVRLYDRRKACWMGDYVHESVKVLGTAGELRGDLLHYTCDDFSQHLQTLDRYTTLAAKEIAASGDSVGLGGVLLAPPWTFLRSYVFQRGFLDGFHGFVIAAMAAFYVFAKHLKARIMMSSR